MAKTNAQVDVNIQTGSNAIGKLAANSGVDIGDVDVLSLPAVVLGAGTAEIGKLAAGVANIGDVDVLTLPALATGTNNIGTVNGSTVTAVENSGQAYDQGGTLRNISRSVCNTTGAGYTSCVSAQGASTRIRVLSLVTGCDLAADMDASWASGAGDEIITGTMTYTDNGGQNWNYTPHGWFQTTANESLGFNASAAHTACGHQIVWVPAQ